jgi:TPR repeat protein
MFKKALALIAGVVLILAFISWEVTVAVHDRTARAFHTGSLNTFLDLLARYADTGNRAKAAYEKGDYTTARRLYQGMADRGNNTAMLPLAVMCVKGQGGPVDNEGAVKWFRVLAEKGDREGQYGMGLSYDNGSGVTQDYAQALGWYRKSAQQGSPAACVNLGVMYVNGHGVTADRIEAQKWFILAGQMGQKNRTMMDRTLTEDENAQAKKRADGFRPGK